MNLKKKLDMIKRRVWNCTKCGNEYKGMSACGFGIYEKGKTFFIGMNPWVKEGEFDYGRGISILKRYFEEWDYDDFFFDNIVKCQMPGNFKPGTSHADNCRVHLDAQIHILEPSKFIIFGSYAARNILGRFPFWEETNFNNTSCYVLPHFSSILYPNGMREKIYYKKLKEIVLC